MKDSFFLVTSTMIKPKIGVRKKEMARPVPKLCPLDLFQYPISTQRARYTGHPMIAGNLLRSMSIVPPLSSCATKRIYYFPRMATNYLKHDIMSSFLYCLRVMRHMSFIPLIIVYVVCGMPQGGICFLSVSSPGQVD